jgi:LmbE family N-acetylglucosaminyl deacetylase
MSEANPVQRVMGVFAHPDDAGFFCGGTLARWALAGAEVTIVVATSGDKGSADPQMTSAQLIEMREAEERAAGQVLGAKEVIFLRHRDGELFPTLELRRDITRLIRLKRPDIVVTLDPTVFWSHTESINHPDHRAIGAATLEAIYPTARDRLNFPEQERDEGLAPHKVLTVYIAGAAEPTVRVDISGEALERKIACLREHKSQIADMEAMEKRVRERGVDVQAPTDQVRYIESFRVIQLTR